MKIKLTLTLLTLVAVSMNLHARDMSKLPAPLPELMNDEQMAKWMADKEAAAAKETASTAPEPTTQFFTGKPFVAAAGGYIFKYRTYNPEMSRWTTSDPSGFPDGINNRAYAPIPVSECDPLGLVTTKPGIPDTTIASFTSGPSLTSVSLTGEAGNGVQTYVDTWTAVWTATVKMTFNNPWPSPYSSDDVATKDATATYIIKLTGDLSYPFMGMNTAPIPISLPTSVGEAIASLFEQGIENYNSSTNVNPLSISNESVGYASNDINQNKPTILQFATQFPAGKYPTFNE